MKNLLVLALLALSLACVAEDRIPLVNPKPAALRPTEVRESEGLFARFAGNMRVDGTLYVQWVGESPKSAEYRLIPSPASSKRLPHFRGYRVTWIEPLDGPATFRTAVDEATYQRILAKKMPFQVTGSWWVADYDVGVECDAAYAHARIRAAKIPDPSIASVERPETC